MNSFKVYKKEQNVNLASKTLNHEQIASSTIKEDMYSEIHMLINKIVQISSQQFH